MNNVEKIVANGEIAHCYQFPFSHNVFKMQQNTSQIDLIDLYKNALYFRKKFASPEDIEYYDIQTEFNEDLYKNCLLVERIIGKICFWYFIKQLGIFF